VGSNRQSKKIDEMNAIKFIPNLGLRHIGSCFPAIQKMSQYLESELDPFLMADVYGNLAFGTSFNRALKSLNDPSLKQEHAEWLFDESKVSVIYAQMQKKANEYPDEEIIFDFYDDRMDIINGLVDYFKRH